MSGDQNKVCKLEITYALYFFALFSENSPTALLKRLLKNALNKQPCKRLYSKKKRIIMFLQYPSRLLGYENYDRKGYD